jgi:ERCC4-type nuclease
MLAVDTREPGNIAMLLTAFGIPYQDQTLPNGDYRIEDKDGCTLGIERKTISDLLGTFGKLRATDGQSRLYSQMSRCSSEYTCSILLIEGHYIFDRRTGRLRIGTRETAWTNAAIQAALFAIQLRYGVKVLNVADVYATIDVLRMLSERAEGGCVLKSQRENADAKRQALDAQ